MIINCKCSVNEDTFPGSFMTAFSHFLVANFFLCRITKIDLLANNPGVSFNYIILYIYNIIFFLNLGFMVLKILGCLEINSGNS